MVVGIARHRAHAGQLKQALRIDGGLERFAHNAGRVVEAEEGIAQAVLRAAEIGPDAGGREPVAAFFDQIGPARDVAAGGRDAAARVLDEAARDEVGPEGERLLLLGKLAVAVVDKDDGARVGGAGGLGHFADGGQVKGIALGIPAAALNVHDGGGFGLLGDEIVVGGKIGMQRAFVVLHAEFAQRAAALARLAQADDALERIVGAAGGGQQRIAGAQQAEQRHRQRVGAAHELRAHQGGFGPHAAGEDLLQLIAAVVPDAVAGRAPKMARLDAGIGEGAQHFELVVVADGFDAGERFAAEREGLFVQGEDFGLYIVKFFDHAGASFL